MSKREQMMDSEGMDAEAQADKLRELRRSKLEALRESDPLLAAIAQNESSSGKNITHKSVNYGLNNGDTAGGSFGLMPLSVKEAYDKSPELREKYPELANQLSDSTAVTTAVNENPELDIDIAKSALNRRRERLGNDADAAYSWKHGVQGAINKRNSKNKADLSKDPYVKAAMASMQSYNMPKPASINPDLEDAEFGKDAPMDASTEAPVEDPSMIDKAKEMYINLSKRHDAITGDSDENPMYKLGKISALRSGATPEEAEEAGRKLAGLSRQTASAGTSVGALSPIGAQSSVARGLVQEIGQVGKAAQLKALGAKVLEKAPSNAPVMSKEIQKEMLRKLMKRGTIK